MFTSKKFFALAKEKGIEPFELRYVKGSTLSIGVFQDQVEDYTLATDAAISGRGIYNGNIGSFSSDKVDNSVAELMVNSIVETATYGHSLDPEFFIGKTYKYKRIRSISKLDDVKSEDLVALCKEISAKTRAKESRVTNCEVSLSFSDNERILENSNGLKLKSKEKYIVLYASTKVVQGEEIETGFDFTIINDLSTFDVDKFVDGLIKKSVDQLGGEVIKTGKYNVLYSEECVASLIQVLMSNVSSFAVDQHLSLFEGKVGQKILSSKLTIVENPYAKNVFASSFDDEGVPTQRKVLVNKGVLSTFVYDLEMAKKYGVTSTGNASLQGGNIRPSLGFIEVKKGKRSKEEIIASMKKGVYITSLQGMHAGMVAQSSNYALQAAGFYIEDGKIVKPVSLITVSGNLIEDFNKVIAVASDAKLTYQAIEAPSILIRALSISGK